MTQKPVSTVHTYGAGQAGALGVKFKETHTVRRRPCVVLSIERCLQCFTPVPTLPNYPSNPGPVFCASALSLSCYRILAAQGDVKTVLSPHAHPTLASQLLQANRLVSSTVPLLEGSSQAKRALHLLALYGQISGGMSPAVSQCATHGPGNESKGGT